MSLFADNAGMFLVIFLVAWILSTAQTTFAQSGASKSVGVAFWDLLLVRAVYAFISSATIFVFVIGAGIAAGEFVEASNGDLNITFFIIFLMIPVMIGAYAIRPFIRTIEKIGPMKNLKVINDKLCEEIMRKQGYAKVK